MRTEFGLMIAEASPQIVEAKVKEAGIDIIRVPLFLSKSTNSIYADSYLKNGLKVQLNINWSNPLIGANAYPDIADYKSRLRMCFDYYAEYKAQMPFIVCENEWDNLDYHIWSAQEYGALLSACVEVAKTYGFKVAEAGITSTSIRRWMYSQLTGAEAAAWRTNYFTGLQNDYDEFIARINQFISVMKTIPYNFANVHWYNLSTCSNGFIKASQKYMQACGKLKYITNEFGIRSNSLQLFTDTVNEIKNNARFAIAYSGVVNEPNKAVELTDEMLKLLNG